MIVHHAGWLLPVASPPLRDGWVAVDDGVIVAMGGPQDRPPGDDRPPDREHAGGSRSGARHDVILPGLVNAHVHLELSWTRGQVPPASSMVCWVRRLMALRRTVSAEPREPMTAAIHEARATGTTLVGDITNTFAAYGPLVESELSAMIFRELLGFDVADPERLVAETRARASELMPVEWLRTSLVPHAPYSVSPGLLAALAVTVDSLPLSIHLAESQEELEFLRSGRGAWRDLLEELGVWNASWQAPGCGPVAYLDRHGLLTERLIAVHAVHLTDAELASLADAGATVVTCPRSNEWTGAGVPPVSRFYASGVRVAVGTDSLASVPNLNMFEEMKAVRRLAPEIEPGTLLRSATLDAARALGFEAQLGSIEPGKRAELLGIRLPAAVTDVEEYLVNGIGAEDVVWLAKH